MRANFSLDRNALFCDETASYRIPMEPKAHSAVKLRFRTGRDNTDYVYVIYNQVEQKMKKVNSVGLFDYYETEIFIEDEQMCYYFEAGKGREYTFYDKSGCTKKSEPWFQFKMTPGFFTPEWAKGAVMYQVYVDRFCNGDPSNDVLDHEYSYVGGHSLQVKEWNKYPDSLDVRCFYGGDLQGVRQKLDYLKTLGVDVIYFNPLFVSPSNHKYDIQDYDYIDPHLAVIKEDGGELLAEDSFDNAKAERYIRRVCSKENLEASNAYFADLVKEIHSRGMRVILDGVFNHCGSFNKWMDREGIYARKDGYAPGAYQSKMSPYYNFFQFYESKGTYNDRYDGWWGFDTLPKLNYEGSRELYDYILNVGRKWVSAPYEVDGWRLDVAADLGYTSEFNHKFWKDFRDAVKEANPDSIILAEHYGDPSSWIQGDQWDTVMNYDAFMDPITWFLTGMEKHSDEYNSYLEGNGKWFFETMINKMSKFQRPSLDISMNELSNHDHSRFLTRTNHRVGRTGKCSPESAGEGINKGIMREAVVLQMTWPGAPTIYYGDEVGQVGWTDPDNRRTFPWGREDWEMYEFHRYAIRIHKRYSCFRTGSLKPLMYDYRLVVYGRFDGNAKAVVIVNNGRDRTSLNVPVWEVEVPRNAFMNRVLQTTETGYNVGVEKLPVVNGVLYINVPPVSATVLVCEQIEQDSGKLDVPNLSGQVPHLHFFS